MTHVEDQSEDDIMMYQSGVGAHCLVGRANDDGVRDVIAYPVRVWNSVQVQAVACLLCFLARRGSFFHSMNWSHVHHYTVELLFCRLVVLAN